MVLISSKASSLAQIFGGIWKRVRGQRWTMLRLNCRHEVELRRNSAYQNFFAFVKASLRRESPFGIALRDITSNSCSLLLGSHLHELAISNNITSVYWLPTGLLSVAFLRGNLRSRSNRAILRSITRAGIFVPLSS